MQHVSPRLRAAVVSAALIATGALVVAPAAPSAGAPASASAGARPTIWDNCTRFNNRYEHGVGRRHAHDQTTSGDPVRNFLRSNKKFRRAMNHNRDLDRDNDNVACEQH